MVSLLTWFILLASVLLTGRRLFHILCGIPFSSATFLFGSFSIASCTSSHIIFSSSHGIYSFLTFFLMWLRTLSILCLYLWGSFILLAGFCGICLPGLSFCLIFVLGGCLVCSHPRVLQWCPFEIPLDLHLSMFFSGPPPLESILLLSILLPCYLLLFPFLFFLGLLFSHPKWQLLCLSISCPILHYSKLSVF